MPSLKLVRPDGEGPEQAGDADILIPDGIYELGYVGGGTANDLAPVGRGDPRVRIWFQIVDGEFAGVRLSKFLRVQARYDAKKRAWISKPKIARSSRYWQEFGRIVGCPPVRWVWPREWLEGCQVEARVLTVKTDFDGDEVPEHAWHSVVRKLLERTAGTPPILRGERS